MDWFERLTGFREADAGYEATRARLAIDGDTLHSLVNGRSYGIGELELVSLQSLRERVEAGSGQPGPLQVRIVRGDVRGMHQLAENSGALFQVASQFNLLEMVSPSVTPEQGVTHYVHDRTQGPACAIAAGAGTIYRNYFAPVGAGNATTYGQTQARQLDGLADMGVALGRAIGMPTSALWSMQNGYALSLDAAGIDALRGLLRIGVHHDVEVTYGDAPQRQRVTQAYCSALPVAYSQLPAPLWEPFAQLVLEAAYEATLCAAILNARRGASNIVLLTRLGGGAFGNNDEWIDAAMHRALSMVAGSGLDVRLVSYGAPSQSLLEMERAFG